MQITEQRKVKKKKKKRRKRKKEKTEKPLSVTKETPVYSLVGLCSNSATPWKHGLSHSNSPTLLFVCEAQ